MNIYLATANAFVAGASFVLMIDRAKQNRSVFAVIYALMFASNLFAAIAGIIRP